MHSFWAVVLEFGSVRIVSMSMLLLHTSVYLLSLTHETCENMSIVVLISTFPLYLWLNLVIDALARNHDAGSCENFEFRWTPWSARQQVTTPALHVHLHWQVALKSPPGHAW